RWCRHWTWDDTRRSARSSTASSRQDQVFPEVAHSARLRPADLHFRSGPLAGILYHDEVLFDLVEARVVAEQPRDHAGASVERGAKLARHDRLVRVQR